VPSSEIPVRIGQAVESMESVPLLAAALEASDVDAPVTTGLARLIAGDLPLDDWVELVRTTVPARAPTRRRVPRPPRGFWRRQYEKVRYPRTRTNGTPPTMLPPEVALLPDVLPSPPRSADPHEPEVPREERLAREARAPCRSACSRR
jgi:hypothetical protein